MNASSRFPNLDRVFESLKISDEDKRKLKNGVMDKLKKGVKLDKIIEVITKP